MLVIANLHLAWKLFAMISIRFTGRQRVCMDLVGIVVMQELSNKRSSVRITAASGEVGMRAPETRDAGSYA